MPTLVFDRDDTSGWRQRHVVRYAWDKVGSVKVTQEILAVSLLGIIASVESSRDAS